MPGLKKASTATKQKSLNAYFKAPAKSDPVEPSSDAPDAPDATDAPDVPDVASDDDEDEAEEEVTTGKKEKYVSPEDSPLPPLSHIPSIFADIVDRIPDILDVAKKINGRKLRVATMCSGTESPLLALNLISRAMEEKWGTKLDIEHVFSCEIVPFKQAYIERNFQPPLLFRDVCELGDQYAHTAYGAKAAVPGNVDMLIAGTSCVDYSNLNNEKKEIDGGGESGRTFHGMLNWVAKHRPPIVILENVCSAPWPNVIKKFESIQYSAQWMRLDTKYFYVPHTRTRGYLMAVNVKGSNLPKKWLDRMNSMKRDASATFDAFLLQSDDPRIHQARERLVQENYNALDRKTGRTDWGRCESRHQRARLEETLGPKRPLTNWDEGGVVKMQDFCWIDWGGGQVERVWDLMDISSLRSAKLGIDAAFKSQVWNLSQNVDRSTGSGRVGISPCLTPSMIPYITNRGGPMVGLEALHLQGLPIDELLLTRESEDQLADLAGNAMSTTVVGTTMLVALVLAQGLLTAGQDQGTYEEKNGTAVVEEAEDDAMDVDIVVDSVDGHIAGEEQLLERPFDLSTTSDLPLAELLADAVKSARLCACEGRKDIVDRQILRCQDCGSTSCVKDGGRPEHNTALVDVEAEPRLAPSVFARNLKAALPMCLKFSDINEQLLESLKGQAAVNISAKRWSSWRSAVLEAVDFELRFLELKRQDVWSATYESEKARLVLNLHPERPEWLFFAKPASSEPANADIRKILLYPVARLLCDTALLSGQWEIALPLASSVSITIKGVGELVPSWEAKLGLQSSEFVDKTVYSKLEVTVSDKDASAFDRSIAGEYTLLDKCGTANNALHKKAVAKDDAGMPALFMLLDPSRSGKVEEDGFVFSTSIRRYEYGEMRPIVARLQPSWRQSSKEGAQTVTCTIPQKFVKAVNVSLKPSHSQSARFSVPQENLEISVDKEACQTANALLVARVPLRDQAGPEWPRGVWQELEPIHERATFKSLSWLIERIKVVNGNFNTWQEVALPEDHSNCERCAPQAPSLRWIKVGRKVTAIEDSAEAGEYERRLKRRPAAFVTQLKLDGEGVGTVRIGVNVPSLTHRALSRLPTANRAGTPVLSWRLDTDFKPLVKLILPKFQLSSNRLDPEHAQPPHFKKFPLRVEQLRSLSWMLEQENPKAPPFIEEEVSEAILDPLGWRAEGRAQKPVHIRGGVLADEVGYGKTAITLGLIDCTREAIAREVEKAPEIPGKINVKATLVPVPPHLTRQWTTESEKFISKKADFKTVTLTTAANLNTVTVRDIMDADTIFVASNLFKSSVYLANLEAFAAGGALPAADGRYFNARLDTSLEALKGQVDRLRTEGSRAVMTEIKASRKKDQEAEEAMRPSKRLKGVHGVAVPKDVSVTSTKAEASSNTAATSATNVATGSRKSSSSFFSHVEVPCPSDVYKKASVMKSDRSSSPIPLESDDDEEPVQPKNRRAAAKVVYVDEDEDEDEKPVKKGRLSKGKRAASPDYVASDEDVNDEDDASFGEESDDEDAPKAKSKGKAKAKPKPKTKLGPKPKKNAKKSEDDDSMDVDDATTSASEASNVSKKRKREEKEEKPKELREAKDPWKLLKDASRDWEDMKAPPLEMFNFARIVVDEYTYLDGKTHALITRLTADRRWVLSGTPPIHDFAAVKTIAAHLDLHLGIDDDGEGQSAQVRKRRREQTAVEKFHSFRETHSLDWHAHRHDIGQAFLDRFVRQNIAEIDEIPWVEKIEKVVLPAAERAIYLELEHHLRALDMTIKRGKKTESDREKRLAQSLGDSNTAEEALLKRCSHFELDTSGKENAMKACEVIVQERKKQLQDCKVELLKKLKEALSKEKDIGRTDDESMFQEHVRVCRTEGVGDEDATEAIKELLNEAGIGPTRISKSGKPMKDSTLREVIWEHREQTHHIRRLTKELVGRLRSLRYFTVVRDLQKQNDEPPVVACPACGRDAVPIEEIAVLSSCGHTGCYTCVKAAADREECVYAASGACKAAARVLNIVRGDTLGVDDVERDGKGKHFGLKLEKVMELIKKRIPSEERVLIFVQFPDLMKKVAEALTANKVPFLEIRGTAAQKSKNLEKFQTDSKERVLLLNVMDESASGANLTSANHAVFLSPLLAASQEIYIACETQAIGRLRRFGQTKLVHIWRFLTTDTIDVEIFEQRTGKKV